MKYLLLVPTALIAVMHGAAPSSAEDILRAIKQRSLNAFKMKESEVKTLHVAQIRSLQLACEDYLEALNVLQELHEHPGVLGAFNKMREIQITIPKGRTHCFQALLESLFGSSNHVRAVEVLTDYDNDTLAALDTIAEEFQVPREQFYEKLAAEQKNLKEIADILKQAQENID